jgi:hypothetical protein
VSRRYDPRSEKLLIHAYLARLAGCELSEESVFKLMGSHLTIKMMDEVCSVLDETKRILQYTRALGADRVLRYGGQDDLALVQTPSRGEVGWALLN